MNKIDIILPVYNAQGVIEECLNSILNQTYKEFNLIIVDDGSTDNSLAICQAFEGEISSLKIISTENNGVSKARNIGIKNSTAEFLCFIDSDDILEPNYVQVLYSYFEIGIDMVIGGYTYFNNEKNKLLVSDFSNISSTCAENVIQNMLVDKTGVKSSLWNKMFRSLIIKRHTLQFNENVSIGEDLIFLGIYLTKVNKLIITNECIYRYRINNEGAMKKIRYQKTFSNQNFDEWEAILFLENYLFERYKNSSIISNSVKTKKIIVANKLLKFSDDIVMNKKLISFIKENIFFICVNRELSIKNKLGILSRIL
ncbi:glycosyltransferase family 2 protein [Enterococcus sp. AZ194]|uniref:glycosyltransferase family 2 protein n=1 Tax=Enterococcus sp. AZ194 TaxID=2774629 RepID=UPI003F687F18